MVITSKYIAGLDYNTFPKVNEDAYTFKGWYEDENLTGRQTLNYEIVPETSKTLYGSVIEKPIQLTVTFVLNGGKLGDDSSDRSITITKGSKFGNMPFPSYSGYSFSGWKDANGNQLSETTIINENKTYYAQWIISSNDNETITYKDNTSSSGDAFEAKTQTAIRNSQVELQRNEFTNPSGEVFIGWNTERDGSGTSYQEYQQINLTSSITLYAQWAQNIRYNLTYDLKNSIATLPQGLLKTYTSDDLPYSPNKPSRTSTSKYGDISSVTKYSTFNKWTPEKLEVGTTGDVTFTGNWISSYKNTQLSNVDLSHDKISTSSLFKKIPEGKYTMSFGNSEITLKHKGSHSGSSHWITVYFAFFDTNNTFAGYAALPHGSAKDITYSANTSEIKPASFSVGIGGITYTVQNTIQYNTTAENATIKLKMNDFTLQVPKGGVKNIYIYLKDNGDCDGGSLSFSSGSSVTLTKV